MSELKTTEDCLNWLVENLPERFRKKGMSLGFVYFEVYCWTDWRVVRTGLKWERVWAEAALREWLTEKSLYWRISHLEGEYAANVAISVGGGVTVFAGESLIALTNAVRRAMEEGLIGHD